MGFFSKKDKTEAIKWTKLESIEALDQFIEKSIDLPVLLFKHSTRCSISSMALSRLERSWSFSEEQILPVYLDLIAFREISNAIAEKTGVQHQSPQAIVLKDKKVIYNASHNSIDLSNIL